MAEKTDVVVLGVHKLSVSDAKVLSIVAEHCEPCYSEAARTRAIQQVHEELDSTVLIEVAVTPDGNFSIDALGQPHSAQAPWLETLLTVDGSSHLPPAEDPDCTFPFRVAFYLHHFDPEQPLTTSYGPRDCPSPTAMPERLARLVPYEYYS